jgi:hypothetical protein
MKGWPKLANTGGADVLCVPSPNAAPDLLLSNGVGARKLRRMLAKRMRAARRRGATP